MNFNEKVWKICARIPKGRVSTYKLIANKLGTNACRAVGNALNKNSNAPGVPCHRVVNSNGRVGGFAGGTQKKVNILRKEGIIIRNGIIDGFEKILYKF